jgi:hypothetical protein
MGKYKQHEIELSPRLLHKIIDLVKSKPAEDYTYVVDNLIELSKADERLTLDEYELIIRKPVSL